MPKQRVFYIGFRYVGPFLCQDVQNIYLKRLTESLEKNEHIYDLDSVEKDTDKLNSKIEDMTKEIDKIISCFKDKKI